MYDRSESSTGRCATAVTFGYVSHSPVDSAWPNKSSICQGRGAKLSVVSSPPSSRTVNTSRLQQLDCRDSWIELLNLSITRDILERWIINELSGRASVVRVHYSVSGRVGLNPAPPTLCELSNHRMRLDVFERLVSKRANC